MAHSPSGSAFDVFLSFRGEDTRKNFTDHLHTALVNARIATFWDERLEKGKVIKEELDNAIRQSRSSVIVLSKEYASSTWCLDELVMILQQRKRTSDYVVLPVFYNVDPSHVRKQTGTVAKAFTVHEETRSSSELERWRTALKEVADLAGMNLHDGHESKFIQKIVREIQDKLGRKPLSDVQEVLKKKLRSANQILNVAEGNQLNNPTVRELLFDFKEVVYDAEDLLQEIKTEELRQEMAQESANQIFNVAEGNRLNNPTVRESLFGFKEVFYDAEDLLQETEELRQEMAQEPANQIHNVAEGNQLNNPTVRESLFDFKEVFYDAEDLLQDTEELRQEMAQELVSTPFQAFDPDLIYSKVDQVLKRLDNISKQTEDVLDSKISAGSKTSQTISTTSLVDEFGVCGRNDEKEKFIRLLLSADESSNKISVIPIVGMGGIGKTTLAQLLYNDDRVKHHFNKQAWACVSENFDVHRILQEIYESLTSEACNIVTLNLLETRLKMILEGKMFFLVLDDMWNKSYDEWDVLRRLFQYGAHGSKIIVTTRNQDVASMVGTFESYYLRSMHEEDGWSLFEKHAFKNAGVGPQLKLEKIGRQIVKMCQGHPLAIKSLGGLLCSKLTMQEWKGILNNEIWELPQKESNILPSLWLSYKDLTLELKRCFGYCSIFPKNYKFKRLDLILLWKAIDLLEPDKKKSAEEVGEDYFKDLISRSFFQLSSTNYYDLEYYTMHDLHNDLASFVSGEFCVRLEGSYSANSSSRTRHVNVELDMFETLDQPKCLRSLISDAKWDMRTRPPLHNLLPKLQCLMVLMLPGYAIEELPDTINNLKHLRQLDLSRTHITRLPDTICTLYNLQVLLLSGCKYLTELPANLGRLIKLTHLDITRTGRLKRMPPDMGNLKDLVMLTKFVVDEDTGGNNLADLKKLQNLRESLCISGLGHSGGLEAYILRDKKFLNELKLDWSEGDAFNPMEEEEVLEKLQPHPNLERLTILGFGGKMLGDWSGYYSSSALVYLELVDCRDCVSLPVLGQLPFLRELRIWRLDGVVSIGSELYYGEDSATTGVNKPFRSLQSLKFSDMRGWKEWSFVVGGDGIATFPNLTILSIESCPKLSLLAETMHSHLPSLVNLRIWGCPELECYFEGGFPSKLKSLEIWGCKKLNAKSVQKLNKGCLRRLTSLEYLQLDFRSEEKVDWSAEMEDEGLFPTTLTSLHIWYLNCETIDGAKWFGHLNSLQTLELWYCGALQCLPESGLPTALQTLNLWDCGALQCLPESGLPSSLSRLEIWACPLLEKRCRRETGEDWPKIAHIGAIWINYENI